MNIKSSDLISLFEKSLSDAPQKSLQEIGIVVQVGDGICRAHGLENAMYNELVTFDGGNKGIILDLEEEYVSIFLFSNTIPVAELETVYRTGEVFKVPVGMHLAGRVINTLGDPIDGLGELRSDDRRSVEAAAPGVIDRSPINEPLETGTLVVDALIPVGKGQRELIIGNRGTGKTALALDAILNQKGKNVFCIFVSIGQRQANLARIIKLLVENGAMEYTTILSADSSDSVLCQYLAPYAGCTIGEYFRSKGHNVLIVYDDLTNHAIAYREMSLLMRRPPGREAFPGDVFYLHSRLLERAGKLASGGSLTALPIIQVQADDITAYIPTNLISITDGQIFLDDQMFKSGMRPAVNIGLSVSRVGGAAQTKAIKKMVRTLGLELAQYRELVDFSQFGADLDPIAQERILRGQRALEVLKQSQFAPYDFVHEPLMLFILHDDLLAGIETAHIRTFVLQFVSYVESVYSKVYASIRETKDVTPETYQKLQDIVKEFRTIFIAPSYSG